MTNTTYSNLTRDPVPALLLSLAVPSSVGLFFNTMYNVVDTFVAGYLSTQALASISISYPIFFALIAVSLGIGSGATALISNALGSNDMSAAKRYAKQTVSFGVMLGIAVSVLGILFVPILLALLGAEGEYLDTAGNYLLTIFYGSVFVTITFMLNAILNATGNTKSYRNFLIAGFFMNGFLSPALAFGWSGLPVLGILGIAVATVITNFLGAIYLWFQVRKTGLIEKESLKFFLPDIKTCLDIAGQGFPASLSLMTVSVGAFIITYFVSSFGESTMAGYGLGLRIEQIVLIPGIGINIAVLALIGQNNGAKKYDRVREIIRVAIRYSLYISTFAAAFILICSGYIIDLFTDDPGVISSGIGYLSVAALITWAYGILFVTDSVFRGLKRPLFPLFMGVLRQIVIPFPVLWFVTTIVAAGIVGVWWSIFIIVWLAAIIAMIFVQKVVSEICVEC